MASPLGADTSDYTNEMQAQHLRDQAAELGISKFAHPSNQPDDDAGPPQTMDEGLAHTREMTQQLAAQRRAIEKEKDRTVSLTRSTPAIIPVKKGGAPIEPAPEEPTPKGPETK